MRRDRGSIEAGGFSRDEFSRETKETLAKRVGHQCSNPDCPIPATSGPHSDPSKFAWMGAAAHITAAAPGGPRYDPKLNSQQRRAPDNGIWLCQRCAPLIDTDVQKYPVALLREWKAQAEDRADVELRGGPSQAPGAAMAVSRNRRTMIEKVRTIWITGFLEKSLFQATAPGPGVERAPAPSPGPWIFWSVAPKRANSPCHPVPRSPNSMKGWTVRS